MLEAIVKNENENFTDYTNNKKRLITNPIDKTPTKRQKENKNNVRIAEAKKNISKI